MKKILYIETNYDTKSPSMKSVVRAFPHVVDYFDEVEVWSCECEIQHPKLKWKKIHAPKIWPLRMLWLIIVVHFMAFWRFVLLRSPRPAVIQCTDFFAFFADIIYVHFHYRRFRQIIKSNHGKITLTLPKKILYSISYVLERACFCWANPKVWLTVSKSMESGLTKIEGLNPVRLLPNAYNAVRFNPRVRSDHRSEMRKNLQIQDEEIVLGFSALGNLQRKGLQLLLEAAQLLRNDNLPVRLLLVGPNETQLKNEIHWSDQLYPFQDIIIVGRVDDTERYFAAMDAFVFPSHCESFCLVIMEAAAMGIPIFPTAFDGHEMTLIEGVNGYSIPWCSQGISNVLRKSWPLITRDQGSAQLARGISDDRFGPELVSIYKSIVEKKSDLGI
jgi:glycosyltransferase involved in cell wall biosynthesis